MRDKYKLFLAGAILAVVATQSNAQTSVTNLVQDLTINLTAYYQAAPTTNETTITRNTGKLSVANKEIIALLGAQVQKTFSSNAKLLIISQTGVDFAPRIVVRDTVSGETVDVDVDQYFKAQSLSTVEKTKIKTEPPNVSGTAYDVLTFHMGLAAVTFDVQGFSEVSVSTVKYKDAPAGVSHSGSFNISGWGLYVISPEITPIPVSIKGTVKISGKKVEVVSGT